MALGDGIRRNIASVDPAERVMLREALIELNNRFFPGTRTENPPGGVSWWFKQDEIHQATHVHGGPAFVPWHREIVNRFEELLRQINPQLSLHYWDWKQDPRSIPNANLGGGTTGTLNLFTPDFMGYGGSSSASIDEPWLSAGYYVPGTANDRDVTGNPADPPADVFRNVDGSPATNADENDPTTGILTQTDFADMRGRMESVHNSMHGFVNMGSQHISFRDPFVFLLHSNVDRLFARWQTDPAFPERLQPETVYGSESGDPELAEFVEPWSTGTSTDQFGVDHLTRPWYAPENQGRPHDYKHPSIVTPPCYDTNFSNNNALVEVMNEGTPPVILFNDIPEGETGARAASFRVYGCRDITIRVKAGAGPTNPFIVLSPASGSVSVPHKQSLFVEARIWFGLLAPDPAVPIADDSVTIECPETGQEFTFTLRGNVIEKPSVAVMLSLDQSGSMDDDAGTSGRKRIDVLKDSARAFAELIPANDGIGLVRFDHDAYNVDDATWPGKAITRIVSDDDFDPERIASLAAVNAHATNPAGYTSVGDGVAKARTYLNDPAVTGYTNKAMIVFTDGLQNRPQSIEDVTGSIDNRTFAIGLGNENQVDTGALYDLTNGTGGFLLLTGLLTDNIDDYFRTKKYFLQILSGVTNDNVVLDPNGYLSPGSTIRIPFYLNEADILCSTMLMWDYPVIDFAVETPAGDIIDMATAAGLGIVAKLSQSSGLYRFTLPVALGGGQQAGRWHVVLKINDGRYKKYARQSDGQNQGNSLAQKGARYCVQINTRSNLKMTALVEQSDFLPGSSVLVKAKLTEYGIPVDHRASCNASVVRPDRTSFDLPMTEVEPGVFQVKFNTDLQGVYRIRIMAKGATMRGKPFTREESRTAAAFRNKPDRGSENPSEGGNPSGGDGTDGRLSELVARCCARSTTLMVISVILLLIIILLLWKIISN